MARGDGAMEGNERLFLEVIKSRKHKEGDFTDLTCEKRVRRAI